MISSLNWKGVIMCKKQTNNNKKSSKRSIVSNFSRVPPRPKPQNKLQTDERNASNRNLSTR